MGIDEFGVIETEEVQDGGMQVVNVEAVLDRVQTEVIGGAIGESTAHAASGHPHGEPGGVMIPAIALFAHGGASELTAPDDERLFEQSACFEVGEQSGDGFIDGAAEAGVVGFDAFVAVPFASCAAVELDEPDSVLDETPCEEAVPAEDSGFGSVDAVEVLGGLGFFGEVDGGGGFCLHLVGEFVSADPGFEFGVIGAGGVEIAVEICEEVEFFALASGVDAFGVVEVLDGNAFRIEFDALVNGGHEAGAPVAHAIDHGAFAVLDHDESGEVFVQGTESVVHPCAEGGASTEHGAGVHGAHAAGVVDAAGCAGVDDGEVVGVLADVFKPVGDPEAALAALFPCSLAFEEGRFGFAHGGDGRFETCGELLSGELVEERFPVERVEVTGAAFHEEEDDVLGLGWAVRDAECGVGEGGGGGERGVACERGEGDGAEAAAGPLEEVSA